MKNKSGKVLDKSDLQDIDNTDSKKNNYVGSIDEKIYNALNTAEMILIKISRINKFLKKKAKEKVVGEVSKKDA